MRGNGVPPMATRGLKRPGLYAEFQPPRRIEFTIDASLRTGPLRRKGDRFPVSEGEQSSVGDGVSRLICLLSPLLIGEA